MKKILYFLTGFTILVSIYACSDDDKYSTSVVKEIQLSLDGEPWAVNFGATNKPLFLYTDDGGYFSNYSSLYRFQLPNGTYRIISTTESDLVPAPENLNAAIIKQDPEARKIIGISAPVVYSSPFTEPLTIPMYTRTGVLRLRATDKVADKSYSIVRAVISTPVAGYKMSDASFVQEPIDVIRHKDTNTGGVNYTDDFVLFETQAINQNVSVRIDYLTQDSTVIQSKIIDGAFPVIANDTLQVAFALNNEDEPVIQNYTVTIASEGWNEEEINPEAPMRIPDGYTYVSPEEDLKKICDALMANPEVTEVKLFLKAGESYSLGRQNDIPKSLYIMGEKPATGQDLTYMEMGNMSISTGGATIDGVRFENLNIKVTDSDFLKFKNQHFHVKEIALVNCEIHDLTRTMWYQEVDAPLAQVLDNFIIENCRFFGLNHGSSGFIGLSTKQDAPIYNIEFRNSTFHANNLSKALITGLGAMTGDLSITIENCTFIGLAPAGMTFFDLAPNNTNSFTLNVKNNLFSGISEAGSGKWFNLKNVTSRLFTTNYHTQDFVMNQWGVDASEEPIETVSMDALFTDVEGRDLTIKDKSSDVYINGIGDPHWIK